MVVLGPGSVWTVRWGCCHGGRGSVVPRTVPWSRVVVDSARAHGWLTVTMAEWALSASHLPSPEEGFAPCHHHLGPPTPFSLGSQSPGNRPSALMLQRS